MIADSEEDAFTHDSRENLLDKERQEDCRDSSEHEVVDDGELLQHEALPRAHDFATTQNDHIVEDDEDARLLQGGHGRDTSLKAELAGRVADEELEDLVEDGP